MQMRLTMPVLAALTVTGCAFGPQDPLPCLDSTDAAATVTVERAWSVVGAPATMFLTLGNRRIYGLPMGERYSFQLDPEMYRIGYDLGFNACRQRVILEPGHRYFVRMSPGCNIDVQDLTDPCATRAL